MKSRCCGVVTEKMRQCAETRAQAVTVQPPRGQVKGQRSSHRGQSGGGLAGSGSATWLEQRTGTDTVGSDDCEPAVEREVAAQNTE